MAKGAARLKRHKKPVRPAVSPAHHVFTNGRITEMAYFSDLAEYVRSNKLTTTVYKPVFVNGTPEHVVAAAIRKRLELEHAHGDLGGVQFWAVVDCDQFPLPQLQQAKREAGTQVNLVLSNPCVELWFLLHHREFGGHLSSDGCQKLYGGINPAYNHDEGKLEVRFSSLTDNVKDAIARARKKGDVLDGGRLRCPATEIWRLIVSVFGEE